jgi:hypothetical protein
MFGQICGPKGHENDSPSFSLGWISIGQPLSSPSPRISSDALILGPRNNTSLKTKRRRGVFERRLAEKDQSCSSSIVHYNSHIYGDNKKLSRRMSPAFPNGNRGRRPFDAMPDWSVYNLGVNALLKHPIPASGFTVFWPLPALSGLCLLLSDS